MAVKLQSLLLLCSSLLSAESALIRGACPDNWVHFQNSCYLFIDENVPWTSAKTMCSISGGDMLEIESQTENDFIVRQLGPRSGINNRGVWIGLQDFSHEGRWVWISSQSPASYTNWETPPQPDNVPGFGEGGQDCAYILPSGVWDDGWCENWYDGTLKPAVACERRAQH